MAHEISKSRMQYLSRFHGKIRIEDVGEGDIVEIVVRLQMDQATASRVYYELGNTE